MRKAVLCAMILLLSAASSRALEKDEILVIFNKNFTGSKELALYYMEKRGIPRENLLELDTVTTENIDRDRYVKTIQMPVEKWLERHRASEKIQCFLLMRGVPLKIDIIFDPEKKKAFEDANREVRAVEKEIKNLETRRKELESAAASNPLKRDETAGDIAEVDAKLAELNAKLAELTPLRDAAREAHEDVWRDTNASVDSELSVTYYRNNPIKRWLPNVLYFRLWSADGREKFPKIFMACRLDGPSDEAVVRMIDDSIAVEEIGLEGTAYFDARGMAPPPEDPELRKKAAYAIYDQWIREAAKFVEGTGVKTVLDNRGQLFALDDKGELVAPGSCKDAALYCGWYRLSRYVPAFEWKKGSVGFHIASGEAGSLRGSECWGKRMIDEGIASTLGPVAEPYLFSFPQPTAYFAFLLSGKYSPVEAFWYSIPWNSWMQTAIGDPLYLPFKRNAKITEEQLQKLLGVAIARPPALDASLREMPVPKPEEEEEEEKENE